MPVRPILVQQVLKSTSGLPTDVYVNDLVIGEAVGAGNSAIAADVATALDAFWNTTRSVAQPVVHWLSQAVSRTIDVKLYDLAGHLDGSPHGSPFLTTTIGLGASAGDVPLPEECAIALSFHADTTGILESAGATRPKARRRARVFLGPWGMQAAAGPVGGHVFVTLNLQTALKEAGAQLITDLNANDMPLQVWSRKDATTRAVTGGWLDNAFDTMRSRGAKPNARVTF